MISASKIIPQKYLKSFSTTDKIIAKFVHMQESEADLATQRIGQELITNTLPKSLFARSFVDLCDNAFREILENIIVYLGPKFVGEKIFQKAFSKKLESKNLKDMVITPAKDLLKNEKNPNNKELMPVKAAIAISALVIPLTEYSLSYVKNLFTLKVFKQANFNNIANLDKSQTENSAHQEKVKKSAKKHIALAGGIFAVCLGFAALLVTRGKNSTPLNHISEFILAPGSKCFKLKKGLTPDKTRQLTKRRDFFDKYFGLDFRSKNVVDKEGKIINDKFGNPIKKLAISNGQITACVTAGAFGYLGAAKDRGKQDFKEVAYRFPLVGFYAISGNELFKDGFTKFMKKSNKCKELFNAQAENEGKMPKFKATEENEKALDYFAEKLALKNITAAEVEYKKLFKQKTILTGVPVLFGFTVMGLFVAGCSRYFTQYRYNKDLKNEKKVIV